MVFALRKIEAAAGVAVCEVPEPVLAPGEVLLHVKAAGLCGSDLHVADWTSTYAFIANWLPVTLGHEFGGTIVESRTPNITFGTGKRAVVVPFRSCGTCTDCRAGRPGECRLKGPFLGFIRDGGFCNWVAVPAENCLPVPDGLDDDALALIEPLTIGAQAVARSHMPKGARVLVVGPGPIGHAIALMAEFEGAAEVVIAGKDDAVRLGCLNKNGFDATVEIAEKPLDSAVSSRMGEAKFDVVFDAAGVTAIYGPSLALLAQGGRLVTAGLPSSPVQLDLTALSRNQQSVIGTHRAPPAIWQRVIDIVSRNPARFKMMISHRIPLRDGQNAFDLCKRRLASKVILVTD